jgi:predicted RecB family endonuclease
VKNFFKKNYKCQDVVADLPNDDFVVRVPRNLRKREIDVVSVRETPKEIVDHLAEGKTVAKSHSFAEAVNQLDDALSSGTCYDCFSRRPNGYGYRRWSARSKRKENRYERIRTASR